jgi:ABC-type polysaccharide/polyol phosphate transport system ATPase subunit
MMNSTSNFDHPAAPLDPANGLELESIAKRFQIITGSSGRLSGFLANRLANRRFRKDLWALDDVSCEVKRGEILGIVGSNGAGKSTLLRIIAGITPPTTGQVRRVGRVAALLDLTAGFHFSLTGYENLFLAAAILGISRERMRAIMPEVINFAGINHAYLEQPVRTYSSGMITRLAFSLAVFTDPDLILIDEVLAVGDAEFQARSAQRLLQFREEGKAMIFVSHSSDAVAELSDRALWLDAGHVRLAGGASEVIKAYSSYLNTRIAQRSRMDAEAAMNDPVIAATVAESAEGIITPPADAVFESVTLDNGDGASCEVFQTNSALRVRMVIQPRVPLQNVDLLYQVLRENRAVMEESTASEHGLELPDGGEPFRVTLRFDPLLLLRGKYTLAFHLIERNNPAKIHGSCNEIHFEVEMPFTASHVMPSLIPSEFSMD